jgi:hypothetical protein
VDSWRRNCSGEQLPMTRGRIPPRRYTNDSTGSRRHYPTTNPRRGASIVEVLPSAAARWLPAHGASGFIPKYLHPLVGSPTRFTRGVRMSCRDSVAGRSRRWLSSRPRSPRRRTHVLCARCAGCCAEGDPDGAGPTMQ